MISCCCKIKRTADHLWERRVRKRNGNASEQIDEWRNDWMNEWMNKSEHRWRREWRRSTDAATVGCQSRGPTPWRWRTCASSSRSSKAAARNRRSFGRWKTATRRHPSAPRSAQSFPVWFAFTQFYLALRSFLYLDIGIHQYFVWSSLPNLYLVFPRVM